MNNLRIQGGRIDGNAERQRLEELGRRVLPPDPRTLCKNVEIPAPRLLTADMERTDRLKVLGTAYRLAIRDITASHFLLHGNPVLNKEAPRLLAAADFMLEHSIPPAGWCMFSKWVWCDYLSKPSHPSVAYTFSSKRLTERLSWYDNLRGSYDLRQVHTTIELRTLTEDWEQMWRTLLLERPVDRARLLQIVDATFPGMVFETRVQRANTMTRQYQAHADKLHLDGGIAKF